MDLQKIAQFLRSLDAPTQAALDDIAQQVHFKKGAYLLRIGAVSRQSFHLKTGAVRKFYLAPDGREITTELLFPDDLALSMKSYSLGEPSHECLQALVDTTATATSREQFEKLKTQFPKLLELDLLLTEWYAIWLENRLTELRTLDATSRYQKLLSEQPHVVQQIPLTYIASFLGISLETLSRIRARV